MKRIWEEPFDHGELHFFPNILEGEGAATERHFHPLYPHVVLLYPGEPGDTVEYEVFALRSSGEEVLLTADAWHFVYIEAGIDHLIRLKRGDRGRFVCMASRIGPDGRLRFDPTAQR